MQDFEQIRAIIKTINIIISAMKEKRVSSEDIENVQLTAEEINDTLYHARRLKFQRKYDLNKEAEYFLYIGEIESLVILWNQTMERRTGKAVDIEFWQTYEYFKYVDVNDIFQAVVRHFLALPEGLRIEYLSLPHRYTFLQNKIDFTKGDFSLIAQHVEMMANEIEKYKWLYERLADYRSKAVLNGIIRYWFRFDVNRLRELCEGVFSDYYDLDILECDENTVMVDLGAFTGDSVADFIHTYGAYKKIYAYELTPSTYQTLVRNVSAYPNVVPVQKGVSNQTCTMYINDAANKAGNRISNAGDTAVEITTLDEDIDEPITVIKMDIEGAEKDALMGAASHIKSDKPKLLISSYHMPEDIFEVPYLIDSLRDDYQFYMRFNGHNGIWPCDYVLFAV